MNVKLVKTLSENVEQPSTSYGRYHDYFLEVEGWPQAGDVTRVVVNTATQGGFRLIKWKFKKEDDRPILKVYLEVSIMGHDLDQWVAYDLTTGERINKTNLA